MLIVVRSNSCILSQFSVFLFHRIRSFLSHENKSVNSIYPLSPCVHAHTQMQACVCVYMHACGGRVLGLGSKHFKGGEGRWTGRLVAFAILKSFWVFPSLNL